MAKTHASCIGKDVEQCMKSTPEYAQAIADLEKRKEEICGTFHPSEREKRCPTQIAFEKTKILEQFQREECKDTSNTVKLRACLKASVILTSKVKSKQGELSRLSKAYGDFQSSLKEENILDMLMKTKIAQIDSKLEGADQNYIQDSLYKKLDETLLGQYIDEKAMAAACAAQDDGLQCNMEDSKLPSSFNGILTKVREHRDSLKTRDEVARAE